jgi:hypothetical protein
MVKLLLSFFVVTVILTLFMLTTRAGIPKLPLLVVIAFQVAVAGGFIRASVAGMYTLVVLIVRTL